MPCLGKFRPKIQSCLFKVNFLSYFEYAEFNDDVYFFSSENILFGVNLVQDIKIVSLS